MPRRPALMMFALVLSVIDVAFLSWIHLAYANAAVTYVGLDSIAFKVPSNEPSLTLRQQHWYLDGRPMSDWTEYLKNRESGPVALITLAPQPTYDQFIRSIRDLKKRKICNVAIREGGEQLESAKLASALILCGHGLGDAGFFGTLPEDGPIRIRVGQQPRVAGNGS